MNQLLKGVNLYLVGMMGSGKTTVGRLLAKELGYHFFDTDAVIEQSQKKSINEIFAEAGEAAFRDLETEVLAQLSSCVRLAIATGGGIVLKRKNWSYLRHGLIVWLDAPVELLYARLQNDATRPLLRESDVSAKLQSLLEQRQSLYGQADLRISLQPGETPEQIASRVIAEIPTVLCPERTPVTELN
uniref:shikimate kinase n=1 Tax=Trichocoleus desertorum TaxID=1481672 RepID=UPI0025B425C4|nr:shikimate kinase [Trichocoleus desertorum]